MKTYNELQAQLDSITRLLIDAGVFEVLCDATAALSSGQLLTEAQQAAYARWAALGGPALVDAMDTWEQLAADGLTPLETTPAA